MITPPSSPLKVAPGTPIPVRKDASWISQEKSPIKSESLQTRTPPRVKKKSCVCSMGRIFSTIFEIPKALFNLVLKIFDLAIQFFHSLINRFFSREYQYPSCPPFTNGDKAIILDFIKQKKYESDDNPQILEGLLHWVVNHPEEIEINDLDALEKWALSHPKTQQTKANLTKISHLRSEQDNIESLTDKQAYCRNLDGMDDQQLANFVQSRDIKGRHSPLHHLFKKELENIGVISATNFEEVGKRFKVILRSLSREQTIALAYYNKFWALIYKYPLEAAQNLDAEKLAILAKNRNKHRVDFNMVVSRLVEDDQLHIKLDAIAPHATTEIELALRGKVERLVNFDFAINGIEATLTQKQELKDSINQKIDDKLAQDRSLATKIMRLFSKLIGY